MRSPAVHALEVRGLSNTYGTGDQAIRAIDDLTFEGVDLASFCASSGHRAAARRRC